MTRRAQPATRTVLVRFTPDEKVEIETLAAHDDRTAAGMVRKIVRDYLRERKRQADFPAPRRVKPGS